MANTLLARLQQMHQYNAVHETIDWQDPTQSRWADFYHQLQPGDGGLFLSSGKLFCGEVGHLITNQSVFFKNVRVCNLKNDDFLRLHAAFPENVARVKANFQPFIPKLSIDYNRVFKDAQNKNFISFYIVKESRFDNLKPQLKENDRVIELDASGKFKSFNIYQSGNLSSFENATGLFNVKSKSLHEILQIQAKANKQDAQTIINNIIAQLQRSDYYKFSTFHQYYMVVHNKLVYLGTTLPEEEPEEKFIIKEPNAALNTILFGPPGTGKTYHTIDKAVSIVNPNFKGETRDEVREEYKRLSDLGRIAFCTFHQSMSYEDFVEGIKPAITSQVDEEEEATEVDKKSTLSYHLVDGIFKRMCKVAQYTPSTATATFSLSDDQFNKAAFYKVSLGRANNAEGDTVYRYCIENNLIAMGWGGWIDYSGKSEQEINELLKEDKISSSDATFIKRFSHRLKIGDYVIVSEGNYWCRAIGRVTGDYEYDEDGPNEYLHFRKVQWLIKDVQIPVEHIYSRQFSMQTLYSLDKGALKKEFFVKDKNEFLNTAGYAGNYVLIIDEINRGNVSHIFGELITLIEDSKREGKEEALEVTLPYSGEKFSVPANLYIIGTMNTADRSVEALDTALRRRFDFEEMNPIPREVKPSQMGKVNLVKMLETINSRLRVLLDKDRSIGHAWLMNIITIEDLKSVFKNRILPLLQEFFYSQPAKIGWVLGDAFIKEEKPTTNIFAAFKTDLEKPDLDEAKVYTFLSIDEMEEKHFISIYDPSVLIQQVNGAEVAPVSQPEAQSVDHE